METASETPSKYEPASTLVANIDPEYAAAASFGHPSSVLSGATALPGVGNSTPLQDGQQRPQSLETPGELKVGARQPDFEEPIVQNVHAVLPLPAQHPIVEEQRNRLSLNESPIVHDGFIPFDVRNVLPLEQARIRLLSLIVDHFIRYHIIPASTESSAEKPVERPKKRKSDDGAIHSEGTQYEGDPNYILPLLFVVNAYESLVSLVNSRIGSVEALQGKSIGLALEASGGLYRRLIEKYPKSGPITFKRRELASADEARKRFPELVGIDEKRVRFIVVNGLELVERPTTMTPQDEEWFRIITGRPEAALYPSDYKFFSHRTKARKSSVSSVGVLQPAIMLTNVVNSLDKNNTLPHFHARNSPSRSRSLSPSQSQPNGKSQSRERQQPQQLNTQQHHETNGHTPQQNLELMNRLARQPASRPASVVRFCDECGANYVRESSKFCVECGTHRFSV